jgi:hypothetical protein
LSQSISFWNVFALLKILSLLRLQFISSRQNGANLRSCARVQQSEGEEGDPAHAADDCDALEQTAWCIVQDAARVERRDHGRQDIKHYHDDSGELGVDYPACPMGIAHATPPKHKAECRQTAKEDGGGAQMNQSMQTVGRRDPWGIAEARVDWEDREHDHKEATKQGQPWSPGGGFARAQCSFKSESKAKQEQSEDQDRDRVHPPPWTQTELAHRKQPGAVVGTGSALDQHHDGKERRPNHTAGEEESSQESLLHRCLLTEETNGQSPVSSRVRIHETKLISRLN